MIELDVDDSTRAQRLGEIRIFLTFSGTSWVEFSILIGRNYFFVIVI